MLTRDLKVLFSGQMGIRRNRFKGVLVKMTSYPDFFGVQLHQNLLTALNKSSSEEYLIYMIFLTVAFLMSWKSANR